MSVSELLKRKPNLLCVNGRSVYMDSMFWIGILSVLFLFLLPRLILGQDSYVTIHDNLDNEVLWRIFITEGNNLIGDNGVTNRIMNGLDVKLLPSQFNVTVWFFLFFSPFQAYVANELVVRLFAYAGMFLLLRKYLIPSVANEKYSWLLYGIAFSFAALPFYSIYGLSIAGQPLLLFALLNLYKRGHSVSDYAIVLFYAFYSSLPLMCFFVLVAIVAWLLIMMYKSRHVSVPVLTALLLLGGAYIIAEHNLLYIMLIEFDYVSHRVVFGDAATIVKDIKQFIEVTADSFVFGIYHAASVHRPIMLAAVVASAVAWQRKDYQRYEYVMLLLLLLLSISIVYSFFNSYLLEDLKGELQIFRTFNFSRFIWFGPTIWFVTLAVSLSIIIRYMKFGKVVSCFFVLLQLAFCLKSTTGASNEFYMNAMLLKDKFNGHKRAQANNIMTYKKFYSESLFDEISQYIDRPKTEYRVVSIGIHPSIAQYNGFYTLDGYQNNYPLEYKMKFRELIAGELQKNENWRSYYDGWGNRCYVFAAELNGLDSNTKYKILEINDLDLNAATLKEMGGEYVFSSVKVNNPEQTGLNLERIFEEEESPWRIFLYKVND